MKKTSKKKKLRPLGSITSDMEPLLEELTDGHDLQWGEIIFLIHSWLAIHRPQQQEQYIAGGNPILYGYESNFNKPYAEWDEE